jgi:polysaccharide biosynthesis transport protein
MEQLPMKETVDLRTLLATAWRRKFVVLVPVVLAAITAWVVTLPQIMKPQYQCQSVLLVQPPPQLSFQLAGIVVNPSQTEQIVRIQSQIRSNEFLDKVITQTRLREAGPFRAWARKNVSRYEGMTEDQLVDLRAKEFLRRSVIASASGERSGPANQVTISLQMEDPDQVFALVNNITRSVIDAGKSDLSEEFQWTSAFSEVQRQEFRTRLDKAEKELEDFQRQHANLQATPGLVGATNVGMAQQLRDGAAVDLTAQGEVVDRLARNLRQEGIDPGAVERVLSAPETAPSLGDARALERAYIRQLLGSEGTAQGTAIQSARKTEDVEQTGRAAMTSAGIKPDAMDRAGEYLSALVHRDLLQARITALDDAIGQYRGRVSAEPEADLQLQRLQQEVASNRSILNAFETQMVASQISAAYGSSKAGEKISVLVPAQRPLDPVWPKRTPIILLAVLTGLGLGVGGATFLEKVDPSFRDVREIERRFGLRVLGTIPNMPAFGKLTRSVPRSPDEREARAARAERVMTRFLDNSPGYQEFRKLVLGLVRAGGPDSRRIMLTSAAVGEGKSVTSACLALALAREFPGDRVVLVDLDTRRPSLSPLFGLNGEEAGGKLVLGTRTWEGDPLFPLILPNLKLLAPSDAGSSGRDAVTVDSIRWLLAKLGEVADRIILDSPPNLPVPDSIIIGPEVDAVIFVVKTGETPRETVRLGIELQQRFGDNIVGILLNNSAEVLPYQHYQAAYDSGDSRRA